AGGQDASAEEIEVVRRADALLKELLEPGGLFRGDRLAVERMEESRAPPHLGERVRGKGMKKFARDRSGTHLLGKDVPGDFREPHGKKNGLAVPPDNGQRRGAGLKRGEPFAQGV